MHDLSKLHDERPERVKSLVAGEVGITRITVAAMREAPTPAHSAKSQSSRTAALLVQANATCARLEQTLARLKKTEHEVGEIHLAELCRRIADLATRPA